MIISELILMLQALNKPDAHIKVSLPSKLYNGVEEFTIVGLLEPADGQKDYSVLGKRHDTSISEDSSVLDNLCMKINILEQNLNKIHHHGEHVRRQVMNLGKQLSKLKKNEDEN